MKPFQELTVVGRDQVNAEFRKVHGGIQELADEIRAVDPQAIEICSTLAKAAVERCDKLNELWRGYNNAGLKDLPHQVSRIDVLEATQEAQDLSVDQFRVRVAKLERHTWRLRLALVGLAIVQGITVGLVVF